MTMKTALVIMTLLGCDCDMQTCQVIEPVHAASWTSVTECEAALSREISSRQAADYPAIAGNCKVREQPIAEVVAETSPEKIAPSGDGAEPPSALASFASHFAQTRRLLLKIVR